MQLEKQAKGKTITLITLIVAGESIYFLPFVLARVFRPTLLEFFEISNTELGLWFSLYGVVAMVSYVLGGPLADRFPARKLMAYALWLTSAGGVLMSLVPSSRAMLLLYAFWGFTTVCLFWAAFIRATREWGGLDFQGRAFGWLEGGRGGVAALLATLSVLLFSQIRSFQWVILAITAITLVSGIMVWVFIPNRSPVRSGTRSKEVFRTVSKLLRMRNTWLLSIIIVCAYVGYKITDDFSLFAREVLGFSEVNAAGIGTIALWMRAVVAILAGYLADRFNRIGVIVVSFALTLAGGLLLGLEIFQGVSTLLLLNLALTAAGIYGLRALYFAVMKEAKIPVDITGTAVGLVCFVGFAPEIFISPWMGHLLDRTPGAAGHADVFMLLSAFALAGLVAGLLFRRSVSS
ncbi:MAG: MFS transporter [Bacteroidales bacterium]|nr:MFS transporter [Bacteroidales bacterium]